VTDHGAKAIGKRIHVGKRWGMGLQTFIICGILMDVIEKLSDVLRCPFIKPLKIGNG